MILHLSFSSPVVTDDAQCDLSRKTISITTTVCDRAGTCITGPEKFEVLGSTLLYYINVTRNVGIVYTLGQARNLLDDPTQRQIIGQSIPGTYLLAQGTASYLGEELRIVTSRNTYLSTSRILNGQQYPKDALVAQHMLMVVINVAKDCQHCLVALDSSTVKTFKGTTYNTTLTQQTCAVGPTN